MTYSQFITKLRIFVGDVEVLTKDAWDGDASNKNFRTTERPILEDSYTISISDVAKAENTDYTVDKDTGLITFTSAPAAGDDNVTAVYEYARLRNDDWLEVIKDVLREWRYKIWAEGLDTTSITTVAKQSEYDLDTISSRIFQVISVMYRTNSNNDWVDVGRDTNIKYIREQNKLQVRPYFDTAGYYFKIRYLEYINDDIAVTDTVPDDVASRYFSAFKYKCGAFYLDRVMSKIVTDAGSKVTRETFESLQSVRQLRKDWEGKAELALARTRPRKPSINIPSVHYKIKH